MFTRWDRWRPVGSVEAHRIEVGALRRRQRSLMAELVGVRDERDEWRAGVGLICGLLGEVSGADPDTAVYAMRRLDDHPESVFKAKIDGRTITFKPDSDVGNTVRMLMGIEDGSTQLVWSGQFGDIPMAMPKTLRIVACGAGADSEWHGRALSEFSMQFAGVLSGVMLPDNKEMPEGDIHEGLASLLQAGPFGPDLWRTPSEPKLS